jgi:hypothetical protein
MLIGKFFKAPPERKRYQIDYSPWLDAGELVQSATFGVIPAGISSPVIDGITINPASTGITFYVSGGAEGVIYKVLPLMVTAGGQTKEDAIQFTVRTP